MDKDQLLEFINILGVEYQFNDFKHGKVKDIVVECPFAPWHHDFGVDRHLGNASIRVYKLPHLFHCFTCEKGGGPLPVMINALKKSGFDSDKCDKLMKIAVDDVLDFNIISKFSFEPDEDEFDLIRMNAYDPPTSAIYAYLSFRDVDLSVVDKYEIMENVDYMALPMRNFNNKIVGVAKRLITDNPKRKRWVYETTTRADMCLYGEQFFNAADDVVLVEGQIDVLYLDGVIDGVVPLGANGSDLSEYQLNVLKRAGSITIIKDNDKAGDKLKKQLVVQLSECVPLMFEAEIPEEYEDPASTPRDILRESYENRVIIRRKTHGKKLVGRRNSRRRRS